MSSAIMVTNLNYRYADGTEALHDVSFVVEEGECVAVIGPNGSGKSTLLLHLNGILSASSTDAPAVSVFGLPATQENLPRIRRSVGLLFQDPEDQLFCPTVFEDEGFGPQQFGYDELRVQETVKKALARVDLWGFEERSPHHLSGGEKRRVCLAGVLACEPSILGQPGQNGRAWMGGIHVAETR